MLFLQEVSSDRTKVAFSVWHLTELNNDMTNTLLKSEDRRTIGWRVLTSVSKFWYLRWHWCFYLESLVVSCYSFVCIHLADEKVIGYWLLYKTIRVMDQSQGLTCGTFYMGSFLFCLSLSYSCLIALSQIPKSTLPKNLSCMIPCTQQLQNSYKHQ